MCVCRLFWNLSTNYIEKTHFLRIISTMSDRPGQWTLWKMLMSCVRYSYDFALTTTSNNFAHLLTMLHTLATIRTFFTAKAEGERESLPKIMIIFGAIAKQMCSGISIVCITVFEVAKCMVAFDGTAISTFHWHVRIWKIVQCKLHKYQSHVCVCADSIQPSAYSNVRHIPLYILTWNNSNNKNRHSKHTTIYCSRISSDDIFQPKANRK